MIRKIGNLVLLLTFFCLFKLTLYAQPSDGKRLKILISRFRPYNESSANRLIEEGLSSIIMFGLINQDYELITTKDSIVARDEEIINLKGISDKPTSLTIKNELIDKEYDFIIYGYYSFKQDEILVTPKIHYIKDGNDYTLQLLRIPNIKQNFNLSDFDNLVITYKEKISSLSKLNSNLLKVAIICSNKEIASISSYEERMYRSFLIEATKSADTISLVDVLSWNTMEPYYSNFRNYDELSDTVNADMIYSIVFNKISDYVIKTNIELYDRNLAKTFRISGFTFDILKFSEVGDYLLKDLYNLLTDIRIKDGFDLNQLDYSEYDQANYEKSGMDLSNTKKYFLSNLVFNHTLELFPNAYNTYYYNYAIGHNFGMLFQYDRAIYYLDKSIIQDPKFAASHYEKGFYYYKLKEYQNAVESFLKAEEIDPNYDNGVLQFYIALCYQYQEKNKQSLTYYKKSIDTGYKPLNDPYYNISLVYSELEDYDGAIDYFIQRSNMNNSDYFSKIYLAYSFYMAGDKAFDSKKYENADKYLDNIEKLEIINQYTDSVSIYNLITDYNDIRRLTSLYLNNYEKAFKITENGIKNGLFDKSTIYKENAFELDYVKSPGNDTKRYKEIIRYYNIHAELNPKDSLLDEVYNNLGFYYCKLGDQNNCLRFVEKSIEANPNNLSYYLNKMELCLVFKKYNELNNISKTVFNSIDLMNQLDSINEYEIMFYFFLVNTNIAQGKDFNDPKIRFEKSITSNDSFISWDFTLFEKWYNEFVNEKKPIIEKMYKYLKTHNNSR